MDESIFTQRTLILVYLHTENRLRSVCAFIIIIIIIIIINNKALLQTQVHIKAVKSLGGLL